MTSCMISFVISYMISYINSLLWYHTSYHVWYNIYTITVFDVASCIFLSRPCIFVHLLKLGLASSQAGPRGCPSRTTRCRVRRRYAAVAGMARISVSQITPHSSLVTFQTGSMDWWELWAGAAHTSQAWSGVDCGGVERHTWEQSGPQSRWQRTASDLWLHSVGVRAYSGRPKARCYLFNMKNYRFRGKNRQVLPIIW